MAEQIHEQAPYTSRPLDKPAVLYIEPLDSVTIRMSARTARYMADCLILSGYFETTAHDIIDALNEVKDKG